MRKTALVTLVDCCLAEKAFADLMTKNSKMEGRSKRFSNAVTFFYPHEMILTSKLTLQIFRVVVEWIYDEIAGPNQRRNERSRLEFIEVAAVICSANVSDDILRRAAAKYKAPFCATEDGSFDLLKTIRSLVVALGSNTAREWQNCGNKKTHFAVLQNESRSKWSENTFDSSKPGAYYPKRVGPFVLVPFVALLRFAFMRPSILPDHFNAFPMNAADADSITRIFLDNRQNAELFRLFFTASG